MKNIIFSGDSFTWGEGLELYIEKEPWISQRKKVSWDDQLRPLRDEESNQFRLDNHFPGLVSKYFNVESKCRENNGGDFLSMVDTVNHRFDKDNTVAIVLQLTQIGRFQYHFERGENCKCKYCQTRTKYQLHQTPYHLSFDIMLHLLDDVPLTKAEIDIIDALNVQEGIYLPKTKEELYKFYNGIDLNIGGLDDVLNHFIPIYHRGIESLYEKIQEWKKICPVYVIDSWCSYWTSPEFYKHEGFKEILLPLLGKDGNYYTSYKEWEDSFEFQRIQNEFEGSENGHPTLEQHQYLAKSIITQLEKDGFKPFENEEVDNETERSETKTII